MPRKRRSYPAELKAKVAVEALREEATMAELAARLHEALDCYGPPEIFNSDQGSQFTSVDFTDVLKGAGIRISMDGKGRWMDNVFIERLWRSLKYECVYLSEFATGSQARTGHRLVDGLLRPAPAPLGAQRPDSRPRRILTTGLTGARGYAPSPGSPRSLESLTPDSTLGL